MLQVTGTSTRCGLPDHALGVRFDGIGRTPGRNKVTRPPGGNHTQQFLPLQATKGVTVSPACDAVTAHLGRNARTPPGNVRASSL